MDCKAIDYRNLPVQADIVAGILRLDLDSTTCFRDLDSYVHADQGVAGLVLRVVNSALYSRGNKIATIPRAISVLGFQVVRSLAMLAFGRSMFARTHDPAFRTHIWQHSLLTALAGQVICTAIGHGTAKDDAFIAGLMHDIGKVLMFTHDPTAYGEVLRRIEAGERSLNAERALFGFDHLDVGREAVTQWRLPERFIDYMARDLERNDIDFHGDPVYLSLAAANSVIGSAGIGARPAADSEERLAPLLAFGLSAEHCAPWLDEAFIPTLMDHDAYQLCMV